MVLGDVYRGKNLAADRAAMGIAPGGPNVRDLIQGVFIRKYRTDTVEVPGQNAKKKEMRKVPRIELECCNFMFEGNIYVTNPSFFNHLQNGQTITGVITDIRDVTSRVMTYAVKLC